MRGVSRPCDDNLQAALGEAKLTGAEIGANEIPIPDEATAQAYVAALKGETASVTSVKVRSSKRTRNVGQRR